jgi:hypothetical protein
MLDIENFRVKEGKFKEFQEWTKANEKTMAERAQKVGWKYLGTFFYVLGTGGLAHGCIMWEISKYADMDASRSLFDDPVWEKMSKELTVLLTYDPLPVQILRPIGEAKIYKFE